MSSKDDVKYFEDPILNFDNSIVYGCSVDLNYAELETFCNGMHF